MQKLTSRYALLPKKDRGLLLTIGVITLIFIGFSLATFKDLLKPADYRQFIVNPLPFLMSIIGCIGIFLASRGKTKAASFLVVIASIITFVLIGTVATEQVYSTIAELMVVVVPLLIALQVLSETELTWIVVISILSRSAIQIFSTYKSSAQLTGMSAQTAAIAQWTAISLAVLFAIYLAFNLSNYGFRVKMILVLGLLTIVPTAVLTSISRNNLEKNLINQANQNLVLSSDQLASAVDSYIQTVLDITRVEAQIPGLEDYVGQSPISIASGDRRFERGTPLEKTTLKTLRSILKKDPLNIISVRLFDRQGTLQLSTNQNENNEYHAADDFYLKPYQTGFPYISAVTINQDGSQVIHFGAPIRTNAGIVNGILDVVYSGSVFQQILVRNGESLGQDVSAMLLDENSVILAHNSRPDWMSKIVNPLDNKTITNLIYAKRLQELKPEKLSLSMTGLSQGLQNISKSQYFSGNFSDPGSIDTSTPDQASATELSALNWYVVAYVPQTSLLAPVRQQTQTVVLFSILISLVSIGIALGITQILVSPILSLTRTSEQIAGGNMNARASVKTQDEIGSLATTFNAMTERVRDLIGGLEQRVAERTKDLEKRAIQLQAAGDVGSTAARLRDLSDMMRQTSRLINQRFGYYHVGIFLLDETGEYAILRATNSEGGQRMLNRGHKLKVGAVGIVGFVTGTGQPRIALNVGQDAEYFNNPDLPHTQSEMALPLIAGGKILGALDIQSTEAAAFSEGDVTTLKVLADQISVAIENARLFSENQLALEASRRAYGEMSLRGWQSLLQSRQDNIGYVSLSQDHVAASSTEISPEFHQALSSGKVIVINHDQTLFLPIKVRGQNIGAIRMDKKEEGDRWTAEDINIANTLAEQLGTALESARLYADTRQRAEREYIISEIASKIGASIQIDTILRTSVEELGRALPDAEVSIQMGGTVQKGGNHG